MLLLAQDTVSRIAGTWKDVGLFAGVVLIVGFGVWKVIAGFVAFLKPQIERLVNGHVKLMDDLAGSSKETATTQANQHLLMERLTERVEIIEENTKSQVQGGEMVRHWTNVLGAIHEDVKHTKSAAERIEGKLKP